MMTSFPSSLLPTLSPVVNFLRTLPLPATHPSHPASATILATLKEAQQGYAEMRGNWSVKCLEGQGKRLVARAESVDSLQTGREFRDWVELMLGTAEASSPVSLRKRKLTFYTGRIQTSSRTQPSIKPTNGVVSFRNAHGPHSQIVQHGAYATHQPRQEIFTQVQFPRLVRIRRIAIASKTLGRRSLSAWVRAHR